MLCRRAQPRGVVPLHLNRALTQVVLRARGSGLTLLGLPQRRAVPNHLLREAVQDGQAALVATAHVRQVESGVREEPGPLRALQRQLADPSMRKKIIYIQMLGQAL